MDYVNLGRTGRRVSRVCLGMMSYGKHESREGALKEHDTEPIVRRAVEGGITFFDTSLKRLELDYVDPYQIHRRGVPTTQIALAWLLHKPGVTAPIAGATKLEHLEDALAAERLSLTDEEIVALEEPYVPHAISGHS